jgi:class 3 adenylate cyclase
VSATEDNTGVDNDIIVSGYSNQQSSEKQRCLANGTSCRPVGIMYADIAAYQPLTELDEEGRHSRLVEAMRLIEAHIDASNGRVAHFSGDAILIKFKDADSALRCAINVQLAARQWNAGLDLAKQICFRVGVDFGTVIAEHGDIYVNAISLTARLESLACCGGICVSKSVRTELTNKSAFKFVAEGKQYVRNIREPIEAFWIEFDSLQILNAEQTVAVKI